MQKILLVDDDVDIARFVEVLNRGARLHSACEAAMAATKSGFFAFDLSLSRRGRTPSRAVRRRRDSTQGTNFPKSSGSRPLR